MASAPAAVKLSMISPSEKVSQREFVENGIIGPKFSLDIEQLLFEFHFATP
jgi:hypothetical protein